jgi:hypothetical protein
MIFKSLLQRFNSFFIVWDKLLSHFPVVHMLISFEWSL